MRSCANCEWCISPDEENEIMEEQGYDEDDINRPHAGDCTIGMIHNKNYVCDKHTYRDCMEEYTNITKKEIDNKLTKKLIIK